MKRFYCLGLFLTLLLGVGFKASALKVTFEWEIPGSVTIQTGSMSGPYVEISEDQTSYEFETESSFGYVYLKATEGYFIENATCGDRTFNRLSSNGGLVSVTVNSSLADKTVKVNCQKLVREDEFSISVENGEKFIKAIFQDSEYAVNLTNGENKIKFNPNIDKNLHFELIKGLGADNIYSIKLNDEPQSIRNFYGSVSCDIPVIAANDVVAVRVFENDNDEPAPAKDCTLALVMSDGLEGCIASIRNWTTSSFIYPSDIKNNQITITEGSDIQINFKEDYTFTSFKLNGTDISESFSSNRLRFVVKEENSTLEITGAAVVYEDFVFKGYIMNPEGVLIYKERYMQNPDDLSSGGETIGNDIKLTGAPIVMDAASTKLYTFTTNAKTPYLYIAPKDGWYIKAVLSDEDGKQEIANIITSEGNGDKVFYVVAYPIVEDAKVDVNVIGSKRIRFSANTTISSQWNNPDRMFTLAEGKNTIKYMDGLDNPFSIRALESFNNFEVWLDGAALSADDNGLFSIEPYYSSDNEIASQVTVYADGTKRGASTRFELTQPKEFGAELYYSPVRHNVAITGQTTAISLLRNTEIAIKPTKPCTLTINDEVVHGKKADGTIINGLNENGEYVFNITGSLCTAAITAMELIEEPKLVDIIEIEPIDGTVLKQLSTINVVVPIIDESMEAMLNTSNEAVSGITLTNGSTTIKVTEIGEPSIKYNNMYQEIGMIFPLIFESTANEAGEYTLTIPQGTFYEVAWDDNAGEFIKKDGGVETSALTATYTIDPNAKSDVEIYTITPADGSTVKSLDLISLAFSKFSAMDYYTSFRWPDEVVISNGNEERTCMVTLDEISFETGNLTVSIVPTDGNYSEKPITEAGTWILNITEGEVLYNGAPIPAIKATFNVDPNMPVYPLSPAPGKVSESLSNITITFPTASVVEYNDTEITLTGKDFSLSTNTALRNNNPNEFTIQFPSTSLEKGEYTLTIPAGSFTLDGETASEEVVAKYQYEPNWIITPASGSEISDVSEITLEFPSAESVEFIGETYSVMFTNGYSYAVNLICTPVDGAEHPTFKFALPTEAQLPPLGMISLRIDEGSFKVDGVVSGEMYTQYVYTQPISLDYVADPMSGTIVYDDYGYFYWTFIFGEQYSVTKGTNYSDITVKINDNVLDKNDYFVEVQSNMILMGVINPDVTEEGILSVSLGAGAFNVSGVASPAIEHNWNIVAPKEYKYTITPDPSSDVADLSKITLSFPEAKNAELFNKGFIELTLNYDYRAQFTVNKIEDAEVPTFEIIIENAPTQNGIYNFKVRSGAFTLDGAHQSPQINVNYTFDENAGITNIETDDTQNITVVTLDGKVIMHNASRSDIKNLSTGLYIINGKKVYIKE